MRGGLRLAVVLTSFLLFAAACDLGGGTTAANSPATSPTQSSPSSSPSSTPTGGPTANPHSTPTPSPPRAPPPPNTFPFPKRREGDGLMAVALGPRRGG